MALTHLVGLCALWGWSTWCCLLLLTLSQLYVLLSRAGTPLGLTEERSACGEPQGWKCLAGQT